MFRSSCLENRSRCKYYFRSSCKKFDQGVKISFFRSSCKDFPDQTVKFFDQAVKVFFFDQTILIHALYTQTLKFATPRRLEATSLAFPHIICDHDSCEEILEVSGTVSCPELVALTSIMMEKGCGRGISNSVQHLDRSLY